MIKTIYMTVGDYWKTKAEEGCFSEDEKRRYTCFFTKWVIPLIGSMKISEVTQTDVERMFRIMREKGVNLDAVKRMKGILRRMFFLAEQERLIKGNPVEHLPGIVVQDPEIVLPDEAEEIALIRAFTRTENPEMYMLLMMTGLTFGELAMCRTGDFSEEDRTLRIVRAVNKRGVIRTLPRGKARKVLLSEAEERLLKTAMQRAKADPREKSRLIFPGKDGKGMFRIPPKDLNTIRETSGLADFKLSHLRKWFVIHATRLQINPKAMNRYMGYTTGYMQSRMGKINIRKDGNKKLEAALSKMAEKEDRPAGRESEEGAK